MRGATARPIPGAADFTISIHAPRAGCDEDFAALLLLARISIHAPRAGCDLTVVFAIMALNDFNPRTPCGVRRRLQAVTRLCMNFNPRTPCGVRRGGAANATHIGIISIHAPRAGCDGKFDGFTRPNLRKRYKKVSVQPKKRAKKKIKEMLCSHSQMLCSHSHIFGWISGAKVPEFPAR